VDESDNLSHEQKESLFHMLSKYRAHFTSKPGLCKIFEYGFEVQCSEPIVDHTRPISFPVWPGVRKKKWFSLYHVCDIDISDTCNSEEPVYRSLI